MKPRTMGISEFKAQCIQILKDLQKDQAPIVITHRGRPVARIEPYTEPGQRRRLGTLENVTEIRGDIVATDLEHDWLMLSESVE